MTVRVNAHKENVIAKTALVPVKIAVAKMVKKHLSNQQRVRKI
jgi:hypothetical protein